VFCNAFPANPSPPGNGTHACGTQFKTNSPVTVNNGTLLNSIVNASTLGPDKEGMYDGNIAPNAAGTTTVRQITGNSNLVLLDSDDITGTHGILALTTTQFQNDGQRADGGTWTYTPLANDHFAPSVLAIKADGGTTVWSIPLVLTAGVYSGFWSTEGIVNNGGQFAALSHGNVYGTLVPLPAAAWMFFSAITGLFGWRGWQRRKGYPAVAA